MRKYLVMMLVLLSACSEKEKKESSVNFKLGQRVVVSKPDDWLSGCQGTIASLDYWTYWKDKDQYEPKWLLIDPKCPYASKKNQPGWMRIPQRYLKEVKNGK